MFIATQRYRGLTASEALIFYNSEPIARRRLFKLYKSGLLDREPAPLVSGAGRCAYRYFLSKAGKELLAENQRTLLTTA